MKGKILGIVMAGLLIGSVAACSSPAEKQVESNASYSISSSVEEEMPIIKEGDNSVASENATEANATSEEVAAELEE